MPDRTEIERYKTKFAELSDEELIAQKHEWVAHSAMHIAAVQILHERQKRPHWSVIPLFWVSVVAAIAACIAAYPVLFPSQAQKADAVNPKVHDESSKTQSQSQQLQPSQQTGARK